MLVGYDKRAAGISCSIRHRATACGEIVAAGRGLSIRNDSEAWPRAILRGVKIYELESEFDFELLIFFEHARPDVDRVPDQRISTLHGNHDLNMVLDHSHP